MNRNFASALLGLMVMAAGPQLPDQSLTPGAVRTDIPAAAACTTRWGTDARHVSAAMSGACSSPMASRSATRPSVRMRDRPSGPPPAFGADVAANLWVQQIFGPWNAHLKDRRRTASTGRSAPGG